MHNLISPRSDDTLSIGLTTPITNNKYNYNNNNMLHDRMASFASSMNHHLQHYYEEEELEFEFDLNEYDNKYKNNKPSMSTIKEIPINKQHNKHIKTRSKSLSNIELNIIDINDNDINPNEYDNNLQFRRANTYTKRNNKKKKKKKNNTKVRRIKSCDYHKKRKHKKHNKK